MGVEDGHQTEAMFLQDMPEPPAGTLPSPSVNQECLLLVAHNEADVAGPRQEVDIVMEMLQLQARSALSSIDCGEIILDGEAKSKDFTDSYRSGAPLCFSSEG